MQITTIDNNGEAITYGYDPEHYENVIAFYQELKEKNDIKEWRIS